jgi:UDP-N-acetylmuramate dehydrogenase
VSRDPDDVTRDPDDVSASDLARALEREIQGRVEVDHPLAALTTYRLGGPARLFVEPASVADVEALGRLLPDELEVLTLGRGSNVVVSDAGWPGVVIRLGSAFAGIEAALDAEGTGLRAGAGTPLPTLANWAARRGLGGLEFLVAIPGSVGGAVRMNAGAHGTSVDRTLAAVTLYDLGGARRIETRRAADLGLTYRHSDVGERALVLEASFDLARADPDEIRTRMDAYRRHRSETQPGALQNAGSVFKNPPGDSAGRLVEAAGLKGFSVGGASVSRLHANFFIASDGASAQDVYDLVHEVRARVRATSAVDLEPEVRFAGRFEDRVGSSS